MMVVEDCRSVRAALEVCAGDTPAPRKGIIAMKNCLLAMAALAGAVSIGCADINLAQSRGGGQYAFPYGGPEASVAQQQTLIAQQQAAATEIQLVGHHAPPGNCPPGYGPHSYAPGSHHPGRPFDGGWYGWHGNPHGTPGYPRRPHHMNREYVGPPGPPTAQVAYPYYTTRGPRDFLVDNPPSIGR
jgi:hypothetical protein